MNPTNLYNIFKTKLAPGLLPFISVDSYRRLLNAEKLAE